MMNKGILMKLSCISAAVLLESALILSACSVPNTVQRQVGANAVIEQITEGDEQGRYRNLYRGERQYPTTCEANCYPAHPQVSCQSPAQNCRYTGPQPVPALNTGFSVQWLGHASFIIHTPDQQQLLLDPVLGQFDWPVSWAQHFAGIIKRPYLPEVSAEQLAQTDAVLYSHLHYDHFSHATMAKIGTAPTYYMPLDMAAYMPSSGYNVVEQAWYSQSKLGELTLHMVQRTTLTAVNCLMTLTVHSGAPG